jgi:putative aminopeptidase FrvX
MTNAKTRRMYEKWLHDITALPTAAGREDRVIAWIEDWVAQRKNLKLKRDKAGNLFITRKPPKGKRIAGRPIFITAHLDHPAFVVRRMIDRRTVEMEFRGGVLDPYFENAPIEIYEENDTVHRATLTELKPKAKPYKRAIAKLTKPTDAIKAGDIGRWRFPGKTPRVTKGIFHTYACDDLAALAAGLAAMDELRTKRNCPNVGLLLTRAEEVGFVGTLAACVAKSIPAKARLICLENSRSFPESPIGGGPILRVGDRLSVFDPTLTNRITDILMAHEKKHPKFKWQRKLMPGGACEATAFSTFGYESTCICFALGNYHNMGDIDGVQAGKRPAKVKPECISIADYHGMVEMLVVTAMQLDSAKLPPLKKRLEKILAENGHVLT